MPFADTRDHCDKCGAFGYYLPEEYYNGKPLCWDCAKSEGLHEYELPHDIDYHDFYDGV